MELFRQAEKEKFFSLWAVNPVQLRGVFYWLREWAFVGFSGEIMRGRAARKFGAAEVGSAWS